MRRNRPHCGGSRNGCFQSNKLQMEPLRKLPGVKKSKAVKWKCRACGHAKHFTKAVTAVACESCPKCNGMVFEPVAQFKSRSGRTVGDDRNERC